MSLVSFAFAGFWPAIVDRAVLNVRQAVGANTETAAAGADAATAQTQAAGGNAATATAATAATQQTAAAGGGAAATAATAATTTTPATAAANPATAATTARTAAAADTDTDTATARTTATPAAAPAPVAGPGGAGAGAAAPAADAPAADPALFSVPFSEQTGSIRYAPMPKKAPSKISIKNFTPQNPTSNAPIFSSPAKQASVAATQTQPFTFTVVSSEAQMPAASPPTDTAMQKFLNRWKD
ncbi:uncharacterized protein HMPREF1541_01501 [Cyphellophora europaea CBS 101466]|uniref:Yeast cell wall synthesis Kre9/Knh1 C-terminal domain-containing protein n=1 Tax=Cyphellophora europaea (strain CBS 101466) TaxID=1220924 RepID=W2S0Z7_CYPE1|nr:uncharacterized protein HMPREF1541_01501 [Cyphellophora europaea CBS 101466]ETN42347.1 hypothetical protein HMPREF1541_01501 [Cyphellophora europaea CBS 101466]